MKLSEHFDLKEFTKSYLADRLNIDNSAALDITLKLKDLCINVLEPIRKHFGKPVRVNSGYRSKALNKAVKGAKRSDHLFGKAADIEIDGVSNLELGKWIEENIPAFKQLIYEYCKKDDPSAGWIHISFDRDNNKKQIISIK